jgi:hypothetical protein
MSSLAWFLQLINDKIILLFDLIVLKPIPGKQNEKII